MHILRIAVGQVFHRLHAIVGLLLLLAGLLPAQAADAHDILSTFLPGHRLLSVWEDGTVRLSAADGTGARIVYRHTTGWDQPALSSSADGRVALIHAEGGVVLSVDDGRVLRTLSGVTHSDDGVTPVVRRWLSASGRWLLADEGADRHLLYPAGADASAPVSLPAAASLPYILAATFPDDAHVVVLSGADAPRRARIASWNRVTGRVEWVHDLTGGKLPEGSFDPAGRRGLIWFAGPHLFDLRSGKVIAEDEQPYDAALRSARWSADSARLAFSWGRNWRLLDAATGRTLADQVDQPPVTIEAVFPDRVLLTRRLPGNSEEPEIVRGFELWSGGPPPRLIAREPLGAGLQVFDPAGGLSLANMQEGGQLFLFDPRRAQVTGCFHVSDRSAAWCAVQLARARFKAAFNTPDGLPSIRAALNGVRPYLQAMESSGLPLDHEQFTEMLLNGSGLLLDDWSTDAQAVFETGLSSRSAVVRAGGRAGLGWVALKRGEPQAAVPILKAALGVYDGAPDDQRARAASDRLPIMRLLAQAQVESGDAQSALATIAAARALPRDPDRWSDELILVEARALRALGRRAEALALLEAQFGSIENGTSDLLADIFIEMAQDYATLDNRKAADEFVGRAIDILQRNRNRSLFLDAVGFRGAQRARYRDTLIAGLADLRLAGTLVTQASAEGARDSDAAARDLAYRNVFVRFIDAAWSADHNGEGTITPPAVPLPGGETQAHAADDPLSRQIAKSQKGSNPHGVYSARFSPDGTRIVTTARDSESGIRGIARLFDTATGAEIVHVETYGSLSCNGPAFSADGTRLFIPLQGLFDSVTGQLIRDAGMMDGRVVETPINFLFFGGHDVADLATFSVTLRRAAGGRPIVLAPHGGVFCPPQSAGSADGRRIAISASPSAADSLVGETTLWDAATGRRIARYDIGDDQIATMAFAPGDRWLVVTRFSEILLCDPVSGKVLRTLARGPAIRLTMNDSAVSADGRTVIGWERNLYGGDLGGSRELALWRPERSTTATALKTAQPVSATALSPDGGTLAVGDGTGGMTLYATADGRILRSFPLHRRKIWSVGFSPDGRSLLTASEDGTVRLSRVADGSLVRHIISP